MIDLNSFQLIMFSSIIFKYSRHFWIIFQTQRMATYDNVPKRVLLCLYDGYMCLQCWEALVFPRRMRTNYTLSEREKERKKERKRMESDSLNGKYMARKRNTLLCVVVCMARVSLYTQIQTIQLKASSNDFAHIFTAIKKAHNNIYSRFSVFRQSIRTYTVCSKAHIDKTKHHEYKYIEEKSVRASELLQRDFQIHLPASVWCSTHECQT